MKVKIFFFLIGSILVLNSCVTSVQTIKLTPVASPEQKITNINNKEFITSQKKYIISLSPYYLPDIGIDKTMFQMLVQNRGDEPIRIEYDNISMTFRDNTNAGALQKINIQSFDDFMTDFDAETKKNEDQWVQNAVSEIQDRHQGRLDDIYYEFEPNGQPPTNETEKAREKAAYDIVIADIKKEKGEIEGQLARRRVKDLQFRNEITGLVMKPQTIIPGEDRLSLVIGDTRNLNKNAVGKFEVVISIEGEEYKFDFDRSLEINKR